MHFFSFAKAPASSVEAAVAPDQTPGTGCRRHCLYPTMGVVWPMHHVRYHQAPFRVPSLCFARLVCPLHSHRVASGGFRDHGQRHCDLTCGLTVGTQCDMTKEGQGFYGGLVRHTQGRIATYLLMPFSAIALAIRMWHRGGVQVTSRISCAPVVCLAVSSLHRILATPLC